MNIDWGAFTPWTSLAGGALIGLSALLFLLANGRIAGISGVLGGLLSPGGDGRHWRAAFVLGLVLAYLIEKAAEAADLVALCEGGAQGLDPAALRARIPREVA